MFRRAIVAFLALLAGTMPAFAHLDPGTHGAFAAGFTHPLSGLDHVLAMLAVGLWAASAGRKAVWAVPTAFVGTMGLGFAAAIAGLPLPFVEPVILASVIFIGIMVALALPLPMAGVATVVAFFALFHGHAHGGEMGDAGMLDYVLGFLSATALLHATGIALALAAARVFSDGRGSAATRIAGGLTALGGLWLAIGG